MHYHEYLTRNEAADLMRISKVTLQRIVNDSQLRKIKIRGKVLFSRVDVDAFINSNAHAVEGGAL